MMQVGKDEELSDAIVPKAKIQKLWGHWHHRWHAHHPHRWHIHIPHFHLQGIVSGVTSAVADACDAIPVVGKVLSSGVRLIEAGVNAVIDFVESSLCQEWRFSLLGVLTGLTKLPMLIGDAFNQAADWLFSQFNVLLPSFIEGLKDILSLPTIDFPFDFDVDFLGIGNLFALMPSAEELIGFSLDLPVLGLKFCGTAAEDIFKHYITPALKERAKSWALNMTSQAK
jgi:hypothetical protein